MTNGIHPKRGDGGVEVKNPTNAGVVGSLHGEPVHVLPDALVEGEQTAMSPDRSSQVTPRQINAVQSEMTSLFEKLGAAESALTGAPPSKKWDTGDVRNLGTGFETYSDAIKAAVDANTAAVEDNSNEIDAIKADIDDIKTGGGGGGGGGGGQVTLEDVTPRGTRVIITPPSSVYVDFDYGEDPPSDHMYEYWGTSPGAPYKTIQGAIDHIASRYSGNSWSGATHRKVNISLAPGVYEPFVVSRSAISEWHIQGGSGQSIVSTSGTSFTCACVVEDATVTIQNTDFVGDEHCVAVSGGRLTMMGVGFTTEKGNTICAMVYGGGKMFLHEAVYVRSNSAGKRILVVIGASSGGAVYTGFLDELTRADANFIIDDDAKVLEIFRAEMGGVITAYITKDSFYPTSATIEYPAGVYTGGIMSTFGAGKKAIPGGRPAWIESSGIYV